MRYSLFRRECLEHNSPCFRWPRTFRLAGTRTVLGVKFVWDIAREESGARVGKWAGSLPITLDIDGRVSYWLPMDCADACYAGLLAGCDQSSKEPAKIVLQFCFIVNSIRPTRMIPRQQGYHKNQSEFAASSKLWEGGKPRKRGRSAKGSLDRQRKTSEP